MDEADYNELMTSYDYLLCKAREIYEMWAGEQFGDGKEYEDHKHRLEVYGPLLDTIKSTNYNILRYLSFLLYLSQATVVCSQDLLQRLENGEEGEEGMDVDAVINTMWQSIADADTLSEINDETWEKRREESDKNSERIGRFTGLWRAGEISDVQLDRLLGASLILQGSQWIRINLEWTLKDAERKWM